MSGLYETKELLSQYLFLHYGRKQDYKFIDPSFESYIDFPKRCITECVDFTGNKALDLGCSVGRTSFELSKKFESVVGIDYSQSFIDAANTIKINHKLKFPYILQGNFENELDFSLPDDIETKKVNFLRADVLELGDEYYENDLVFAANLLCRLSEPAKFLHLCKKLVKRRGKLLLISPYSWLEEYTNPKNWLSVNGESEDIITTILQPEFNLIKKKELPFLIREHARKYQLGISQALLFEKSKN